MPATQTILFPAVTLLAWTAFAFALYTRLREHRTDTRGPRSLVAGTCLFLALDFTTGLPAVWQWTNRLTEYGDIGLLITHWYSFGFTTCLLCLLLLWNYPMRGAAPRIALAVTVLATAQIATTLLFLAVEADHVANAESYLDWYTVSPGFTAYVLIGQAILICVLAWSAPLSHRFARIAQDRHLRHGLTCITAGSVLALGQCLIRVAVVIAAQFGTSLQYLDAAAEACIGSGAALIMTGLTLPTAAPRITSARTRMRHHSAYRRLEPLWAVLTTATPEVVLHPPKAAHRHPLKDGRISYRLIRRVIEIHDGELTLRRYTDPTWEPDLTRQHADRGLTEIDLRAAVHAQMLRRALTAKAEGTTPRDYQHATPETEDTARADHREPSFDDDIRWLLRVARAMKSSTRTCPSGANGTPAGATVLDTNPVTEP